MKKLFTKTDLIIALAVLVLGFALLLFLKLTPQGETAVITAEGREEIKIPLSGEYEKIKVNGVVICRENGEIYIKSSDCRDKICQRSGHLSKKGETAVCAPNRVAVRIYGRDKNAPQAVTE